MRGLRLLLLVAAATLGCAASAQAAPAGPASWPGHGGPFTPTLQNGPAGTIRFDDRGNAIDAHDGEIQRFGDRYYLYGTSYGCGYRWNDDGTPFCGFRSYSSTDLVHWHDEGPLFDATSATWQERCNGSTYGCYRPHVVYDERTRRYVLWINTYDVGVGYRVFTSRRPDGPFAEQAVPKLAVNATSPPGVNNGDHDVFVDDDGTAYLVFTDWLRGGDIVVEQLDRDDLTGTGRYARVGLKSVEAPSMFRRGSSYYLTVSDPNCGFCTTGTSYLRASSPLGPWHGAGTVPDSWTVSDGSLLVNGGDVGLSKAGADWTDYDVDFTATPLQTAGGGAYAQAGWTFRAQGAGDGYLWLLGNYAHPGAEGGNLTKITMVGGTAVSTDVVKLPFPVTGGTSYQVRTTLRGDRIETRIDGQLVDTTTDGRNTSGRIGFRENGGDGEQARFDDVRVTAPDGSDLLSDDFSGGLGAWDRPAALQQGIKISPDSCGGQPADVSRLPGRGGQTFLFQSDRWNAADPNEALATHHWEPLRFDADGGILPLTCGASFDVPLSGARAGRDRRAIGLDQTSGQAGFSAFDDVSGGLRRAQTFTAGRTGWLGRVAFTSFQRGLPDGPLTVAVARVGRDGRPGRTIVSRTVPADRVDWAPREVDLCARAPVRRGERLAIVVSSTSTRRGFGMAYSDADPYPGGGAWISNDGGAAWIAEHGRDLKFETSLGRSWWSASASC